MRLPLRKLAAFVISAIPMASLALLWVHSYWRSDYVGWRSRVATDQHGQVFDFYSRTPQQWGKSHGTRIDGRYFSARAGQGGFALFWSADRYLITDKLPLNAMFVQEEESKQRQTSDPLTNGLRIGSVQPSGYPIFSVRPRFGFAYYHRDSSPPADVLQYWRATGFAMPLWLPLLLSALPPLWYARRLHRAWRDSSTGKCPHCGYDLRATPGQCPECGATHAISTTA